MQDIPCQSRLGLGVFSERRSFLLFNPVEVCGNYDALEGAITGSTGAWLGRATAMSPKAFIRRSKSPRSLKSDLDLLHGRS